MRSSLVVWVLLCSSSLWAQEVRWASSVLDFSSEYSDTYYGAAQACGKPNTPPGLHYPSAVAWSPLTDEEGLEWIRLAYDQPLEGVQQIAIVESQHPGAISRVFLESGSRRWMVYEDLFPEPAGRPYRLFRIFIEASRYRVTGIRIELRTDKVPGYNHIDAVAISNSRRPVEAEPDLADFDIPAPKDLLGPAVNSRFGEIHPLVSPDGNTLYFTRKKHPGNVGDRGSDDVWVSRRNESGNWSRARNMGAPINTIHHDYLNGISPDGSMALIGRDNGREGEGDDLMLVRIEDGHWTKPQQMRIRNYYNLHEWQSFHLASDANTILMSVQRRDGQGMKDLYVSFLEADGSWSEPRNLGADINTAADETTPFLAPDGKTLYFATDGRYGYGWADIFVSHRLDDSWTSWSEPLNLGPRINSPGWDANFSIEATGRWAYFNSINPENGSHDIYRIEVREGESIDDVVLVRGRVLDYFSRAPLEAGIEYEQKPSGKHAGSAQSRQDDGAYQIVLPGGLAYDFFAETPGYYALTESIDLRELEDYGEVERDILMIPVQPGNIIPMRSVDFEANKAELKPASYAELDRIAAFLVAHAGLTVEIAGHTNNLCGTDFCRELSEKRARSVMRYLKSKGVREDRVFAVGYGKEQPIADNATADGRRQNQRVEFRIVRLEQTED